MTNEFRIVYDENHNPVILNENNEPASEAQIYFLMLNLNERYTPQPYIYLCRSWKNALFKIGISGDLKRRMNELGGVLLHYIQCRELTIRDRERDLHTIFAGWRVHGEWFRFNQQEDRIVGIIRSLQSERELLDWIHLQSDPDGVVKSLLSEKHQPISGISQQNL